MAIACGHEARFGPAFQAVGRVDLEKEMEFGLKHHMHLVDFSQEFPEPRRLKLDREQLMKVMGNLEVQSSVEYLDISRCGIEDASMPELCLWIGNGFPKLRALNMSMNLIGRQGWQIFTHYLHSHSTFHNIIMLDIHHNKQPGCAAAVNAVNFAVGKSHSFSGRLLDRLGLYKMLVQRNYQAISEVLPLRKLEILIFSFEIEDSLKLCTQIRAGVFPHIRLLQTPTCLHLDLDGRIRRAVMALEQAMDARSMGRELDEYRLRMTKWRD